MAKLRDLRRDVDSCARPSATYPVGNALDDWLAIRLSGRSARTKELYRAAVEALRERLDDVKPRELTAGDVQGTLDALAERLSPRSRQIVRNCLKRPSGTPKSGTWTAGTWRRGQAACGTVGSPVQEPDSGAGSAAAADCGFAAGCRHTTIGRHALYPAGPR
jgi:hypothetical protein